MIRWDRREDDLVVGLVRPTEVPILRAGLLELRTRVLDRLGELTVECPLGENMALTVSSSLPEDYVLLRLLAAFLPNTPREGWSLHERDVKRAGVWL